VSYHEERQARTRIGGHEASEFLPVVEDNRAKIILKFSSVVFTARPADTTKPPFMLGHCHNINNV